MKSVYLIFNLQLWGTFVLRVGDLGVFCRCVFSMVR